MSAVGVELKEAVGVRLWDVGRRHERLVEGAEQRKRIQPCFLEPGAKIRRDGRRGSTRHGSRMR